MVAESSDEFGGGRNGGLVFKQQLETVAELDDKAGPELARDAGKGGATGWSMARSGHPGEDARAAADWQEVENHAT